MDWLTVVACVLASFLFLTAIFFVARAKNRYDVIDIAWGLAFIAIAGVSYIVQSEIKFISVQTLTTLLVIVWGLRLSLHINARWSHSTKEDARYTDMRHKYSKLPGGAALNMYTRVFLVQAILAVIISTSVIIINASAPVPLGWAAVIGVIIWMIGFFFESTGDKQLQNHLANPKNKTKLMTSGLWKYTRHPNYFGEAIQWWGIWVIALSVPFGWVGMISPIVITILLVFISGVPLTEKRFEGRPGWEKYKKETSIFLPLPPKRG